MSDNKLSRSEIDEIVAEARAWWDDGATLNIPYDTAVNLPPMCEGYAEGVIAERLRTRERERANQPPPASGEFREGGHLYIPRADEPIEFAIETMLAKAAEIQGNVRAEFNGTPMSAVPGESVRAVWSRWTYLRGLASRGK